MLKGVNYMKKIKVCPVCKAELPKTDKFCSVCGKRFAVGKGKKILRCLTAVLIIMTILVATGIAVFLSRYLTPYNKQMRLADSLLKKGYYIEAAYAYEDASKIEPMIDRAYMGQAKALASVPGMDWDDAKEISNILVNGYIKTKNIDLIFYFKDVAKIVEKNKNEFFATKFEMDYYRHLPVNITEKDVSIEDIIYADCIRAFDFWNEWIYGQFYTDPSKTNSAGQAKVTHLEINTKNKLEAAIKSHFADELAEQYIDALNPCEDGALYINVANGIGDHGIEIYDHNFIKVSDRKYMLTLRLYNSYEFGSRNDVDESGLVESKVLCTYSGKKWIFENHSDLKFFGDCNAIDKSNEVEVLPEESETL